MKRSHSMIALGVAGLALALAGCSTLRDASGQSKDPPDEFAITTKAPLIIPPDYNLRPPKPGTAPLNQVSPTQAAQGALFNADTAAVANSITGNFSEGEKLLLAYAGVQNADPAIRQRLASDEKSMQGSDTGFTDEVLFWEKPAPPTGTGLDANAAAKNIAAEKAGTAAPGQPSQNAQAPPEKEHKSGGWFDWF